MKEHAKNGKGARRAPRQEKGEGHCVELNEGSAPRGNRRHPHKSAQETPPTSHRVRTLLPLPTLSAADLTNCH